MSACDALEPVLRGILLTVQPSRDDWRVRQHIVNELQAVVQSLESLRGATVEPFGSFVSNLFTRSGDLDISIELSNGAYISSAGKRHKISLLGGVLKALRMAGGWRKLQFIPNARVPILKLESMYQNISCDISINNLKGLIKSKFLLWISGIDGRFRDLVLLVKEWAKAHAINNSKTGYLNSYSFTLLVIFHFQTCEPAILPPLKEIYPGNIVDELSGVRDAVERHIEEICAKNIARFKSDRRRRINGSSLPELFISFLAKFSDIGLRASHQGICPFTGQWEDIRTNMRWQPKTYAIFIEDPFEQPENAGRAVSSGRLTKISEAFAVTHCELVRPIKNRNSIVDILIRPQICKSIARSPLCGPSISGGSQVISHRQVHMPAYSLTQLRPQFQNMSLENRPNSSTVQRPVQASQGQQQRVWKPRYNK